MMRAGVVGSPSKLATKQMLRWSPVSPLARGAGLSHFEGRIGSRGLLRIAAWQCVQPSQQVIAQDECTPTRLAGFQPPGLNFIEDGGAANAGEACGVHNADCQR